MSGISALVDEQIAEAEKRLGILRDIEALAAQLDDEPESVAPQPRPKKTKPPKRKATSPRTQKKRADIEAIILKVVKEQGATKPRDLAEAVDVYPDDKHFREALRALIERNELEAVGQTNGRRYRLPSSGQGHAEVDRNKRNMDARVREVALKARILKLVAEDPGALTEERIAQQLEADREQVADACGALLLDDRVIFNPDKTYSPAAMNGATP